MASQGVPEFSEISEAVEAATTDVVVVDAALIGRTLVRASQAPRRRARVLLHPHQDDSLHEMLIALPQDSCDVPHINFKSGKSFLVMHGAMSVMVFADDGSIVTPYRLEYGSREDGSMLRLNRPCWHTIIPHSDYVVFIETIIGPFTGNRFAGWAPRPEGAAGWGKFSDSLRRIAAGKLGDKPDLR